ncbi:MAG: HlyD family efflux transporter periplasmic adaptor subunit [Xanthomonadales bacterium]|nr:HlyD family efflux transporter periplasmic adaptor subunit [Xanthomonadales bacterium]MCB1633598.1 HlyD family efflux transporter periplasmic adaptor subunit [Xanthomonadales bacterium]
MDSLFRPQVGAAREQDWMGSVRLLRHRLGWWLALLPAGTVLVLAGLLLFGEYTRAAHMRGQLLPSGGLVRVAAPVSGSVSRVAVDEGQQVEAGAVLIELSIERDSGSVGRTADAVAAELASQRQRQQTELDELSRSTVRQQQLLQQQRQALRSQLALLESTRAIRRQQFEGAQRLLEQIEPIRASGQLTALQIHQYETAALEAKAQVDLVQLQHLNLSAEIADLSAQLAELPESEKRQRNQLLGALAETSQAIAHNAAEQSLVIRAPRAGRVSGLTVVDGQSVQQTQALLALIPEGSSLQAELWVPASAIGRIEVGRRVAMRYDAFPYQQYGQQYGRIVEIGLRALTPEEILRVADLSVESPAYRALVEPDQQQIDTPSGRHQLRTSMTLDAAVTLDRRRLYELLNLPLGRQADPSPLAAADQEQP